MEWSLTDALACKLGYKWDSMPYWQFLGWLQTIPFVIYCTGMSRGHYRSLYIRDYLMTSAWFSTHNAPEIIRRLGFVWTPGEFTALCRLLVLGRRPQDEKGTHWEGREKRRKEGSGKNGKLKKMKWGKKVKVVFRDFFFFFLLLVLLAKCVCIIEFVVYTFVTCWVCDLVQLRSLTV